MTLLHKFARINQKAKELSQELKEAGKVTERAAILFEEMGNLTRELNAGERDLFQKIMEQGKDLSEFSERDN